MPDLKKINNSLEKLLRNAPMKVALGINALLFAFFLFFFIPYFQTNDDTSMMLFLSGLLRTVKNTEYVLFINILLARGIKSFYLFQPSVQWYGLFLVSCVWAAYCFLLYLLLKTRPFMIVLLGYLFFFFTIGYTVLVGLQFTSVSGMLAIAGLTGVFYPENPLKKPLLWVRSAGILLYFLSCLLRFEAWLLVSVLYLPFIFFLFLSEKKSIIKSIFPFGISLLLCFASLFYHQEEYRKHDNYARFNALRGEILDYNVIDKLQEEKKQEVLRAVNWTDTELNLLNSWFFMEPEVYSEKNLKKVVSLAKQNAGERKEIWWQSGFSFIKETLKEQKKHLIISLLFVFIALFGIKKENIPFLFLQLIFIFIVFSGITWYLKPPPPRIVINGLMLIHWVVLFSLGDAFKISDYTQTPFRKFVLLLSGAAFLLYLLYAFAMMRVYHDVTTRCLVNQQNFREGIHQLKKQMKASSPFFVSWGVSFPFEYVSPFRDNRFMDSMYVFSLGSLSRNEASAQLLAHFHYADFHRTVFDGKMIFFIREDRILQDIPTLSHFQQKYYQQSLIPRYHGKLIRDDNHMFSFQATSEIIPDSVLANQLKNLRLE